MTLLEPDGILKYFAIFTQCIVIVFWVTRDQDYNVTISPHLDAFNYGLVRGGVSYCTEKEIL